MHELCPRKSMYGHKTPSPNCDIQSMKTTGHIEKCMEQQSKTFFKLKVLLLGRERIKWTGIKTIEARYNVYRFFQRTSFLKNLSYRQIL